MGRRFSKEIYIYVLIDPRNGDVRYVGKTTETASRLQNHLWEAKARKRITHKSNWIWSLLCANIKPELQVVEVVSPGGDWQEAERRWIRYYRSILDGRLTNTTGGGDGWSTGMRHSPETKQKISAGNRLPQESVGSMVLLWNQGFTREQIADTIGCHVTVVGKYLSESGVKYKRGYASSKYHGVMFDPSKCKGGRWRTVMMIDGKRTHIGWFRTETEAARAYNNKAIQLGYPESMLNVIPD